VVRSVIASLRSTDDSGPATQVYSGCTGHNTALAANPAGSGGALDLNLKFTEGFSYAFRERLSQSSQAVPGYGYFAESGFYNSNLTGGLSNAGLADNGTRFIARFSAVPAGVHLFVTVSPSPYGTGGVYVIPDAHLVSADGSGAGIANDTSATASVTINGKSVGIAPVTLVDGAGEAAWEIRRVDPNAAESLMVMPQSTQMERPSDPCKTDQSAHEQQEYVHSDRLLLGEQLRSTSGAGGAAFDKTGLPGRRASEVLVSCF